MKIRTSRESDRLTLLAIHNQSFGEKEGPVIAKLVDDLLDDKTASPHLSLVAEEEGKLTGHVLFTRAKIADTKEPVSARILAPLAVLPEAQGKGIGQALIHDGLKQLKTSGVDLVFVLGHPTYYPRCGFTPAGKHGLEAPHTIPEENADAWMVQALNDTPLGSLQGTVQCSKILNAPQHWRE